MTWPSTWVVQPSHTEAAWRRPYMSIRHAVPGDISARKNARAPRSRQFYGSTVAQYLDRLIIFADDQASPAAATDAVEQYCMAQRSMRRRHESGRTSQLKPRGETSPGGKATGIVGVYGYSYGRLSGRRKPLLLPTSDVRLGEARLAESGAGLDNDDRRWLDSSALSISGPAARQAADHAMPISQPGARPPVT